MVTMGGWFQQRSNLEKYLLVLSSILIFVSLILFIVIVVSQSGGDSPGGSGPTCWSKECIKKAGKMLSRMSEDSKPCSNFYDYACGGYSNTPGQIKSMARSSMDYVYLTIKNLLESPSNSDVPDIDSINTLYTSCMEYEGLQVGGKKPDETLKLLMAKVGVGTWPVIDAYFDVDSNLSLEERLVGLLFIGIPIAFKVEIVPDLRVNGSFIMKLSPGGPHAAGRLERDIRGDAQLKTHLLSSFLLLGAPYTRASADVDDILSVDNQYAAIEQAMSTDCDVTNTLTPEESLSELIALIPGTDWSVLLNAIQKAAGLSRSFAVQVYCKDKIKEYMDYLTDLSLRSSYNYLGWRFFSTFLPHIMPALRRPQVINGAGYQRWRDCVRLLEQYAAPSLARALTSHMIQNATIEKIKGLTSDIKSEMENSLSGTSWLDREEKTRTQQQLKSIEVHLPFIQKHIKKERSFLLPREISPENYTSVIIELQRQKFSQVLKNLNPAQEHTQDSQKLRLTSDSASSESSYVTIPFDRVQEPYFSMEAPDWINFGGFGMFAARELFKALLAQNLGVSVEDETTLWDIWYRDASGCFLNSLASSFGLTDGNELIKRKWIKELFLDTSSLEIAYQSTTAGLTSKKKLPGFPEHSVRLFFITYAQTFCASANDEANYQYIPISDRINAVMSNSKSFQKAFSCDATTTCEIWS